MSIETAAGTMAGHLEHQDFVEIYAHHDADGIAAASIMCLAMVRKDKKFRLRIVSELPEEGIQSGSGLLLCDLGSGRPDLRDDAMVIDHHLPGFSGGYHVNPRLFGIDGDRELCASGAAYLVANALGDNRDLAGLAVLGMIGDGQEISGKNKEIFNEGVAEGIITNGRGFHLTGRDPTERLYISTAPYLPGISGNQAAVESILDLSTGDEEADPSLLLSLLILETGEVAGTGVARKLYGDLFGLERESIADAYTLAAVTDACGKTGKGGLAASLCMRSTAGIEEAWEITRSFRLRVIAALDQLCRQENQDGVYEIDDHLVISDVADALAYNCREGQTVIVLGKDGEVCRVSARCPGGGTRDLGVVIQKIASDCGGSGGGHRLRAGATIPCSKVSQFRSAWQEAVLA
ncbi:MAG TPA: DHH family phosphoesterase [Methanoregulaceae archaeon]|nr:DHH family phosphoesterase [Methanoregulaceae archaeon]